MSINRQLQKILLTGDRGYIGPVLASALLERGYEVIGYDCGYFADNQLDTVTTNYQQITKDIRDIHEDDLQSIGGVIHLAGLSNDPLGEFAPKLTEEINYKATIKLATLAKKMGTSRFVYASSQSMYGISNTENELDEDHSEKRPLTAYAATKWQAEQELHKTLASERFVVTSLRPSTVFGASPRLRCDIVFNNLLACAYSTGKIEIKSDGTPWRPIVHIKDVCAAFIAVLEAPAELVSKQAFNVGVPDGNFTIKDIAEAAQRAIPESKLIFTNEHNKDPRTYRVSFKKILTVLKDYYKPQYTLDMGGAELVDFFNKINFTESQFRGRMTTRLEQLLYLKKMKDIDHSFRFIEK